MGTSGPTARTAWAQIAARALGVLPWAHSYPLWPDFLLHAAGGGCSMSVLVPDRVAVRAHQWALSVIFPPVTPSGYHQEHHPRPISARP